jgi:hypothetical protein
VVDGCIELACPFSGGPTAFAVILPRRTGAVRLLRRRRARHHCGEPLAFAAAAARPSPESEGVMV